MENTTEAPVKQGTDEKKPVPIPVTGKLIANLVPFTAVAFDGSDGWQAMLRVALYGTGAILLWKKARSVSYALCGATAISMMTSLSATKPPTV